jgi:hypothetical protein
MPDTTSPHGVPFMEDADSLGGIAAWSEAIAEWVNDNVGRVASGTATVPISAINTAGSVAVTFPAGRFSAAPKVALAAELVATAMDDRVSIAVHGVTSTGCTIRGLRESAVADIVVQWIAHQQ